jgi:hypothetical protein
MAAVKNACAGEGQVRRMDLSPVLQTGPSFSHSGPSTHPRRHIRCPRPFTPFLVARNGEKSLLRAYLRLCKVAGTTLRYSTSRVVTDRLLWRR